MRAGANGSYSPDVWAGRFHEMRKHMNNTFQLSMNNWDKRRSIVVARVDLLTWTGSYPLRSAMQPVPELPARHVDLAHRCGIEDPIERLDESGVDRQHRGGSRPGARG